MYLFKLWVSLNICTGVRLLDPMDKDMASQAAQWAKSLHIVQETQQTRVRSLGVEDPLEEEMAPTPVFLPGESHGQRSLEGYSSQGRKELDTTKVTKHAYMHAWIQM